MYLCVDRTRGEHRLCVHAGAHVSTVAALGDQEALVELMGGRYMSTWLTLDCHCIASRKRARLWKSGERLLSDHLYMGMEDV